MNTEKTIKALQRFVRIPCEDDKRKGDDKIQIHNGVQCALDGYRAGIILPNEVEDWDLSDAYIDYIILKETTVEIKKGRKKEQSVVIVEEPSRLDLSRTFNDSVGYIDDFTIDRQNIKRLITSCKELQAEHMKSRSKLPAITKTPQNRYGKIFINVNGMEVITEDDAKKLRNNVICFNIKYFRDALEFILCSKNDEIYFWYGSSVKPFVMKSGKLYAMVLPIRII